MKQPFLELDERARRRAESFLRRRLRERPKSIGFFGRAALRIVSPHERLWQERSQWSRREMMEGGLTLGRHSFGDPMVIRYEGDTASVSYTHLTLPTKG